MVLSVLIVASTGVVKRSRSLATNQQAVSVAVLDASPQRYGLDTYTDPSRPWKSLEAGKSDGLILDVRPHSGYTDITYNIAAAPLATLRPTIPTNARQLVTIDALAAGRTRLEATWAGPPKTIVLELGVAIYRPQAKTVSIRVIHEQNDDLQVTPVDQGVRDQDAIGAGVDGVLESSLSGDDEVRVDVVTTGANGISETTASGDDVQLLAVGTGVPNSPCVDPGSNGFLDTSPDPGDRATGVGISTGPDGVCDSVAKNTPTRSTSIDVNAVRSYLNSVAYNQAVTTWTVKRLPPLEVNFDLDRSGTLDVSSAWMNPECRAIRDAAADYSSDYNIFIVDNPDDKSLGWMQYGQRFGFVHTDRSNHPANTLAHELGHGAFRLGHPATDLENLMHRKALKPQRLRKRQWDKINP